MWRELSLTLFALSGIGLGGISIASTWSLHLFNSGN
jgi:hypothetical protein